MISVRVYSEPSFFRNAVVTVPSSAEVKVPIRLSVSSRSVKTAPGSAFPAQSCFLNVMPGLLLVTVSSRTVELAPVTLPSR